MLAASIGHTRLDSTLPNLSAGKSFVRAIYAAVGASAEAIGFWKHCKRDPAAGDWVQVIFSAPKVQAPLGEGVTSDPTAKTQLLRCMTPEVMRQVFNFAEETLPGAWLSSRSTLAAA